MSSPIANRPYVYILAIAVEDAAGATAPAITLPSGWTSIATVSNSPLLRIQLAYQVGTAIAPSGTVTFDRNCYGGVQMFRYINVDTSSPIDVSATNTGEATTSIVSPTITTTENGARLISLYATSGGSGDVVPPGAETEQGDLLGTNLRASFADESQSTAGATGTRTATASASGEVAAIHTSLRPVNPIATYFDDFRQITTANFAHFSDADARVLGWGKDRLFAMGLKSGTTHRFFEVGSTTTSVERDELPDGYVGTDICELGGYVYYSYYRGPRSIISSWDGTTPEIAVQLPLGETVLSMAALANGSMLIGARRIGSTSGTIGQGVLYVGKPDGQGQLSLTRVTVIGEDDGSDYGIRSVIGYGDFGFFTWSYADGTSSGIGIYDPSTGGYARHLYGGSVPAATDDVVVFKGRRIFTRSSRGVYVEDTTYVDSGSLVSSIIDWNMDKAKMLLQAEAGFLPLAAGEIVSLDYSLDGGDTFTRIAEEETNGTEVVTGNIRLPAKQAQFRVNLTAGTSAATTPTVKKAGISAIYGFKPRAIIRGYLTAEGRNKAGVPNTAKALNTIRSNLKTLRAAQTIVDVQLPEWESSTDTLKCVVSQAHIVRKPQQDGRVMKYVYFELREVPS